MAENKRKIKITDTTLRDGQQSLIATRMTIDEILPVIEKIDDIGYNSIEMWGGATFDSTLRYLKEDPWERLVKIKNAAKKTKLQMLLRGQNLLGYKIYPDDVVQYFVQKSVANGIDIIRTFDALNDKRNLEVVLKAAKKEGAHVQMAIAYTLSKVHTTKFFIDLAKEYEDMGADSICIKDMSGLLLPYTASELVKGIKQFTKLEISIHSHYTTALASMTYLKAIEAGADIIDTAISPFSLGTSQPCTEVMVEVLKGTMYDTGLDDKKLVEIADYFKPMREKALQSGLLSPKVLSVDISTLVSQVPGGMLSNLVSQLKEQKAEDKFEEVMKEIPKVREDLGFPPLVTPTSQIVGSQAVMNVLLGERYKIVPKETKDMVRGMYGKMPAPVNPEIQKLIIGTEKPITARPASLLKNVLPKLKDEIKEYITKDEDVLSYALFSKVALDFFKYRQAQKYGVDPAFADAENNVYPV